MNSVWRASIRGKFEAKRRIQELIEHSENEFVVIDDPVEYISANTIRSISRPLAKTLTHGHLDNHLLPFFGTR